jgi:hypothetical protein
MFYHARISVISYLFDRFVHVFQIRFKHFPTNQGEIHFYWCSPIDNKMYPTPQGLSLTFEQFDKLKDVARVLLDLIPDLNTTQFKRKSTRYIDLNLTIFFPLYSTRTLQVNIFFKSTGRKKQKLFTQFKILNRLLFTVYFTGQKAKVGHVRHISAFRSFSSYQHKGFSNFNCINRFSKTLVFGEHIS